MPTNEKTINVVMSQEMYDDVSDFAEEKDRSRGWVVREAIREMLYQDEPENVGDAVTVPIVLAWGAHTCSRCGDQFAALGWSVELSPANLREPVCPFCASQDPELAYWQAYCEATTLVDRMMRLAPDQGTRDFMAKGLADVAGHFAMWRWPQEAITGDLSDVDEEDLPSPVSQVAMDQLLARIKGRHA